MVVDDGTGTERVQVFVHQHEETAEDGHDGFSISMKDSKVKAIKGLTDKDVGRKEAIWRH